MLGPLPRLYHLLLWVVTLGFCVGAGAWLASWTNVPVVASVGAGAGALIGVLVAYLLAHDFRAEPRTVRIRRH
ncbi:hypothetical protein [Nocardioides sp.]|uniref:hypothetical protein n=1 Tax=Nocardioides sp. TaxID=35761 RepID=UPI002732B894|nr:hypothetical protein [Nocardioides sp.]MDP3893885.1 hypothetical protein [Nocardioides sp.]